jgi:hypothetical protein
VRHRIVALTGVLLALSGPAAAQPQVAPVCRQAVATVMAPARSYAIVAVPKFGGRVFVYVPEIRRAAGNAFAPFDLWLVEGVYTPPFLEPRAPMAEDSFQELRKSRNVRAQSIRVAGSPTVRQMTIRRLAIVLDAGVNTQKGVDVVTARFCRG